MSGIHGREFTSDELDTIKKLWPTAISNRALAAKIGRGIGVMTRAANFHLGLRSRAASRRYAELVNQTSAEKFSEIVILP